MKTIAFVFAVLVSVSPAFAQGDKVEAGKRFSAGVALYNEADYRAALVEFKRAYDIAPSPVVLYNIGQTYYQLQDYASAFKVLTRYLNEAGPNAEHRAEVTQTVQQLQGRVGKIDVTTVEPGADVTIDEEMVGKTPLATPILVSIGRRKVTVSAPGKSTQTRFVDVAAGDTVRQEIVFPAPETKPLPSAPPPRERGSGSNLATYAWVTTGVFAAGTAVFGVLAWRASNDLDDLRETYPVAKSKLDDQSSTVKRYSYLADGLGIATAITGGVALAITVLRSDDKERAKPERSSTTIGVSPTGVVVGGRF
jgi:tetratricopeptide (TPR) repeat protein